MAGRGRERNRDGGWNGVSGRKRLVVEVGQGEGSGFDEHATAAGFAKCAGSDGVCERGPTERPVRSRARHFNGDGGGDDELWRLNTTPRRRCRRRRRDNDVVIAASFATARFTVNSKIIKPNYCFDIFFFFFL